MAARTRPDWKASLGSSLGFASHLFRAPCAVVRTKYFVFAALFPFCPPLSTGGPSLSFVLVACSPSQVFVSGEAIRGFCFAGPPPSSLPVVFEPAPAFSNYPPPLAKEERKPQRGKLLKRARGRTEKHPRQSFFSSSWLSCTCTFEPSQRTPPAGAFGAAATLWFPFACALVRLLVPSLCLSAFLPFCLSPFSSSSGGQKPWSVLLAGSGLGQTAAS